MKKKNIDEEHCPYCKRHCSLDNPHCSKGKTLAKEKKKESKKESKKAQVTLTAALHTEESVGITEITDIKSKDFNQADIEEWSRIEEDARFLDLFQKCFDILSDRKVGNRRNKNKKFSILTLLAEKGELKQKDLKACMRISYKDLERFLHKLKKKGYVNLVQGDVENTRVSLTESALLLWKSNEKRKGRDSSVFSILDKEEKEYLEKILRKLCQEQ